MGSPKLRHWNSKSVFHCSGTSEKYAQRKTKLKLARNLVLQLENHIYRTDGATHSTYVWLCLKDFYLVFVLRFNKYSTLILCRSPFKFISTSHNTTTTEASYLLTPFEVRQSQITSCFNWAMTSCSKSVYSDHKSYKCKRNLKT